MIRFLPRLFRWPQHTRTPQERDTKGRYTTNRRHALMKAQLMRARLGLPADPRLEAR